MCNQCKGFSERFRLSTPREYLDLVRQLEELVATGVFQLLQGTCTLKELLERGPWPDDVISHIFECSNCRQKFKLAAETYHGSGATWEMLLAAGSAEIQ
jgi:hypothetical protein